MNKVKTKNIIKSIILILIATVILILGGKKFSEASAIGNLNSRISTEHGITYLKIIGGEVHGYVPFDSNDPVVYCVSHHDGAYSATHKYKIECYIEISGKTARKYNYDSHGNPVLMNTYNDTANAKMAFILGGKITNGRSSTTHDINTKGEGMVEYDSHRQRIGFTDRQAALWLYFNYWSQKVGLDPSRWVKTSDNNNPDTGGNTDITTNSINRHGVNLFNSNAENYANSLGSSGVASVSSLVGNRVIASNTSAGPFKFRYSGHITSIVVKDVDNNVISSNKIKFKNSSGHEITSASSITSGQNFYIENSSSQTLGSLTISVSMPTRIDAKIWLLPGPHVDGDSSRVHQNLIVAQTSTHNSEASASARVIIETGGSIKIEKKDSSTGESLNAGFKIKTSYGWLKGSRGRYIYNASENNASIYRSGTIDKLNFDTYHIYEVEAPRGYRLKYQKGYNSDKKWVDFGESGKLTIDENHIEIIKEFKNVKSQNIKIYKEDFDTKERLKGAGFKIFSVDDNGWVGNNSDPNSKEKYIYNLSYENATEYYTNENGELKIDNITLGEYNIYETKAPDGYDLTAQAGYDGEKVLVKPVVLNSKTSDFADKIKYVAHKGLHDSKDAASRGGIPENSNAAFIKAARDPDIYGIEADLYTTNDGKFVMFHDATLGASSQILRVDSGYGYLLRKGIQQISSRELQHVHLSNGEPLPTLDQYLGACRDGNKMAVLEVKNVRRDKLDDMMNRIRHYGMFDKTILISQNRVNGKSYLQYIAENVQYGRRIKMMVLKHNDYTAVRNSGANLIGEDLGIVATRNLVSQNRSIQKLAGLWTLYADGQGSPGQTLNDFKEFIGNVYNANPPNFQYITIDDKATMNAFKEYLREKYSYVTMSISNEKVISISGYIWEDRELGKQEGFNNLYDYMKNEDNVNYSEKKIANVLVSLIDKTKPEGQGVIARTCTDANGEYKFDGHLYIKIVDGHIEHLIKEPTVKNLYVEFNYTEMIIPDVDVRNPLEDSGKRRKYIPVAFNSETYGNIVENGSRAVMDDVATRDIDLSNIATTYKGNDDKENIYGLGADGNLYKRLYVKNDYTLKNINLGIKELVITDHSITQNLQYVKIKFKEYEYKYDYDEENNRRGESDEEESDEEDKREETAPIVNFEEQNGIRKTYTRPIYPSDIADNIINGTEDLEIYVTYQISITNTTTFDIKELYQERNLYVTNLIDEFDAYRYTIWDADWENAGTKDGGKTGVTSFKNIQSIFGNGIKKNDTISVPITFKVNHDAIVEILKNPKGKTVGIQETIPTKATSTAYHGYERVDYSWKNVRNTNSINANENPAPHITQNEVRHSESLSLIFKLGEQRTIKGNVFEDTVTEDSKNSNEKLGNGIYDYDNENYIDDEGVKVELLAAVNGVNNINNTDTILADLRPTFLYGEEDNKAISKTAETVTKDGYYEFEGVKPGKYYLRFTYGNGKQKIYDVNGDPVSDSKVNIKNYKSTIVTSNATKNALTGQDTKNGEWYKYLEGDKYSVAVDNMQSVESAQKDMDGRKLSDAQDNPTEAMAITAMTSITIENTIENEANNSTIEKMNGANYIYKGFNFGIIKRPETSLVLNKLITNLRLVNTQGNVIFDGNPEDGNLKGVNDLDYEKNSGSRFSRIEIDPNQLYGSTLTISYTITITNNSDVNYYGRKYYWYGEDKVHQVTVTPKDVKDYFDTTLTYISLYEKEDDKYYDEYNKVKTFIAEQDNNIKSIKIEEDEQDSTRKLVTINGFNRLYTTQNSNNKSEDCQDFVRIIEQRLLSTNDDDMIILNTGVMTNVDSTSIDPTQYQSGTIPADADNSQDLNVVETFYDNIVKDKVATEEEEKAGRVIKARDFEALHLVSGTTVTITPPTGNDKISPVLYIATGIISLAILTAGIVIIKKKVL